MLVLTLGVSQWVASLLVALFLIICLLLILIVLIQRPQGGGLGGAFGAGGGSGQTAFGAKTGDALTIATIGIFVLYLLIAVGLQFVARPSGMTGQPAAIGTAGMPEETPEDADGVVPTTPESSEPETPAGEGDDAPADGTEPEDVPPAQAGPDDGSGGVDEPGGG